MRSSGLAGAADGRLVGPCPAPPAPSTLVLVSTVSWNSAEPVITRSVGMIFTVELTNGVMLLWPPPSRICRREAGSCGIAVRPIASPSGWRIRRTYSASWRIAGHLLQHVEHVRRLFGGEAERLGRLLVLHVAVGVGDHELVLPLRSSRGRSSSSGRIASAERNGL